MNLSAISATSAFGKAIRLPARLIPPRAMIPIRRGAAKGLKWTVSANTHGCWLGTYELEKQNALARFVRTGMTVFDVGAQAGFFSLVMSRLVGPAGRVIAFEPFPVGANDLLRHLQVNAISNVTVILAAVGAHAALAPFSTDKNSCMNGFADRSLTLVPTIRLDDLSYHPSVIKVDVEGAETLVLTGARSLIERERPILFIALHGRDQFVAITELLEAMCYDKFSLDGTRIEGIPTTDEIYAVPR